MKRKHVILLSIFVAALLFVAFGSGMRIGAAGYFPAAIFPHRSHIQISPPHNSPDISLAGSDTPDGRRYDTCLYFDQLRRTPPAGFGPAEPRLTAFQAAVLARNAFTTAFPAYKHWDIERVQLVFVTDGGVRYGLYEVEFAFFDHSDGTGGWWTPQFHFYIAVLLDGTVIMPRLEEPQPQ